MSKKTGNKAGNNNTAKKLTLEDFIARKLQKENDTTAIKEVYIASMGGNATVVKCSLNIILDIMDKVDDNTGLREQMAVSKELIYECMPMLQRKELQELYDLPVPYDIVTELFEVDEIMNLGQEILSFYGLDKINSKIKNS